MPSPRQRLKLNAGPKLPLVAVLATQLLSRGTDGFSRYAMRLRYAMASIRKSRLQQIPEPSVQFLGVGAQMACRRRGRRGVFL